MGKLLGNPQLIRWTILLALFTPVFAAPMHSQSVEVNPVSENTPQVTPSPQESTQPQSADPKVVNPTPDNPERTRQAQIEADTKKLYQLSAELRAEVAKTYKGTLSLTVLKKAEEVEALAKDLRILMSIEAAKAH